MAVDIFGKILMLLVGVYIVERILLLLGSFAIVCKSMYSCKHFLQTNFNFSITWKILHYVLVLQLRVVSLDPGYI